ncbi:MAG: MaoC family dehydratase N-terminal domain-containing protein [Chloroflexi bacterium]|nr:MaoC family dehydratase N-terminal domain-containing protein [Chloroflexota bacterium]
MLTDEVRAWIGREASYTAPEEIGRAGIRYFALALEDENPLYRDEELASRTRHRGIVAPPTLVCETNQVYDRRPDPDGYVGHTWDLPLPECRMIRGGNDYEFFQAVRPSDRITATWRLADVYERETSRGGLMLFVISEISYRNQSGDLLAINRETVIYQPK